MDKNCNTVCRTSNMSHISNILKASNRHRIETTEVHGRLHDVDLGQSSELPTVIEYIP
jgi:hypothetical protein